jgi:ribonuclease HII
MKNKTYLKFALIKIYKAKKIGKAMKYLIGIDDAGRGPAIGPMILAGVIINEEEQEKLKKLEVKDSKLLTPKKRKNIGEEIKKKFRFHFEKTSPKEIDESENLNTLEAIKAVMI